MKKFLKLFSVKPAKVNKTEDERQKWERTTKENTYVNNQKKIKETEEKKNNFKRRWKKEKTPLTKQAKGSTELKNSVGWLSDFVRYIWVILDLI